MVDRWTGNVLSWAMPSACALCGDITSADPVCPACVSDLPRIVGACPRCGIPLPAPATCAACALEAPPVERVVAALEFRGSARALVHGLKFRGQLPLARTLGGELARAVRSGGPVSVDVVVPVPLHRRRLRERGFNQARELARVLASDFGVPLAPPGVVLRRRGTLPQTELAGVGARRRNVSGAFQAEPAGLSGRRVALLDDVMTTGATLYELARAVRAAGAAAVEVWTCCRATLPGKG